MSEIIDKVIAILTTVVWTNAIWQYLFAILLFFALRIIFTRFQKKVVKNIAKRWSPSDRHIGRIIADAIQSIPGYFYILQAIYLPTFILHFPGNRDIGIGIFFGIMIAIQCIQIIYKLIIFIIQETLFVGDEDGEHNSSFDKNSQSAMEFLIKLVIWIIGILLVLSNVGINITPLIASLGVGGIAIGFAMQSILSDMFSSLSIFFDKPFKVGDFIIVGTDMGTVKDISLKSTRIQTLNGQELILPNRDVTASRINNYANITRRRHEFTIGVIYETSPELLKKIPMLLEEAISHHDKVTFRWAVFSGFGDFSLNFDIVYHVDYPDMSDFLKTKQDINYDIVDIFAKHNIQFAYPTQMMYTKAVDTQNKTI